MKRNKSPPPVPPPPPPLSSPSSCSSSSSSSSSRIRVAVEVCLHDLLHAIEDIALDSAQLIFNLCSRAAMFCHQHAPSTAGWACDVTQTVFAVCATLFVTATSRIPILSGLQQKIMTVSQIKQAVDGEIQQVRNYVDRIPPRNRRHCGSNNNSNNNIDNSRNSFAPPPPPPPPSSSSRVCIGLKKRSRGVAASSKGGGPNRNDSDMKNTKKKSESSCASKLIEELSERAMQRKKIQGQGKVKEEKTSTAKTRNKDEDKVMMGGLTGVATMEEEGNSDAAVKRKNAIKVRDGGGLCDDDIGDDLQGQMAEDDYKENNQFRDVDVDGSVAASTPVLSCRVEGDDNGIEGDVSDNSGKNNIKNTTQSLMDCLTSRRVLKTTGARLSGGGTLHLPTKTKHIDKGDLASLCSAGLSSKFMKAGFGAGYDTPPLSGPTSRMNSTWEDDTDALSE